MTERENLPSKIDAQDVVVTTTQRGSLVARGLQAVENSKQKALTKNNEVNTAEGQYRLGLKYDSGDGVPQDYEEAVKWYRLAADQCHVMAQFNLGSMYDHGQGVLQDYVEAMKWYRLAADQGYAKAQYNIGSMYDNGQGVEKNDVQAVYWFRKVSDSDSKMLSLVQWLRTLPPGGKLTVEMPDLPSTKITHPPKK